ncbi:MAG TPA: hypothetical protein DC024_00465 [Clostridiales bacterium]|jgi:hypothetical protein|nr:hypothetical protein [Clostridiales bacterium]
MALRFRRSKRLSKFGRINLSKTGVGFSFGIPGFRVGVNSKGKVRRTIGIPGTGVYDVKEVSPYKSQRAINTCHSCNGRIGQKDAFCRHCDSMYIILIKGRR